MPCRKDESERVGSGPHQLLDAACDTAPVHDVEVVHDDDERFVQLCEAVEQLHDEPRRRCGTRGRQA